MATREQGHEGDLRLRAAVESSPSGLLMIDAEGRIVLVNREVERLFGYSREELLGRPVELLVPERFRGQHPGFRAGFMSNPKARSMGAGRDLHGRHKSGAEIPVEIGLTPVATQDGIFVLSSVVDISARKKAEKERLELENQLRQSQKMEAVGRLAGGIAHDFNNILAAIIGFAELAQADADPDSRAADIDALLHAAKSGKDLVESILRFSRRQEVKRLPMNLSRTVETASRLLKTTLPANVRLRFRFDARSGQVMADATCVQQVLMNLAHNAAQAMPAGGDLEIALDDYYARDHFIRAHPGLLEGPYVMLQVRDTGVGMDEATQARAFEPFFTTKSRGKGTGLGLSIVHGIMRDHNGTVWIESTPERGTTVKCIFPAIQSDGDDALAAEVEIPQGAGERILFVEDQAALATIGKRRLEQLGYQVITFMDPQQAEDAFALHPGDFDLLVTDYSMPGMNGLALAEAINRIRPGLPVLMITGYMDHFAPEEIERAGIRKVAKKPLTHLELAQAIHDLLQMVREK